MTVYFVTGKLGQGKTLGAVRQIEEYLQKGKRVATNLDLFPDKFLPVRRKNVDIIRLPDHPRPEDLDALGTGDNRPIEEYDESRFGALVLDELGTWLNTRSWNDKSRAAVIDWFLHARKMHWDVYLIIQDLQAVDGQLLRALCQYNVTLTKITDIPIPIIGSLIRLAIEKFKLPNIHIGSIRPNTSQTGRSLRRWWFNASYLYPAYLTGQCFTDGQQILDGELVDMRASYCLLSPWLTKGRYLPTRQQVIANFIQSPKTIYAAIALSFIVNFVVTGFDIPAMPSTGNLVNTVTASELVEESPVTSSVESGLSEVATAAAVPVVEVEPELVKPTIESEFGEVSISGSFKKSYILRTEKLGYMTPSEARHKGITAYYRDTCDGDIYYQGDKLQIRCTRVLDLAEYKGVVKSSLSQPSAKIKASKNPN